MSATAPAGEGIAVHGPYPRRALIDLLNDAAAGTGPRHAGSIATGLAQTIALPAPPTGRHMLARLTLSEYPPDGHWDAPDFATVTPWTCVFEDVTLFGDGGIVLAGGAVVQDTLAHCEPGRQWFADQPDGVSLFSAGAPERLEGRWLSLLGGGHWNFYHWMVDGIGRLAAADAALLARCRGVLVPASPVAVAAETLARSGILRAREVRMVGPQDVFQCDRLVVPWAMAAMFQPHPRLVSWLAALVPPGALGPRRRLYIDRRGASNRVLANEGEVIAALARFGVEAVALEGLGLAEQAALFADAELVVAPHGAGLVNLVFAPRDCRIVELLSDAYANWCFRRLAAAAGLDYDCVIGRAWDGEAGAQVHARPWLVPPTHVQAAVAAALER